MAQWSDTNEITKIYQGEIPMKLLRETIRKILLESEQNQQYEKLFPLLDSYDLQNVQQGIELSSALGFGEVVKHVVKKGGAKGRGISHVFTFKPSRPFMEYVSRVFDENQGSSPNSHIYQAGDMYSFSNFRKRELEIFAQDPTEKWSDYSEDMWEDEVELPI